MKRFVLVLLVLAFTGTLSASEYVYQDGYYFKGGVAYTRVDQGYYYFDRYYCRWVWYPSYVYTPVKVEITSPDFESQLLSIAAARDKVEGSLRIQAQKHQTRLELIDRLGLTQNFYWHNYGVGSAYHIRQNYGVPNLGSYGVSGNTLYGYSAFTDLYGTTDLNVLYQQSASLTKGAQELAGQAKVGFDDLVRGAGLSAAVVAQIREQGIAAREALNAAKAAPQSSQGVQGVVPQVMPKIEVKNNLFPAANSCVPCHAGQKVEGKFDVTMWGKFTQETKIEIVRKVLVTNDPNKIMPRDEKGQGHRLTPAQISEFLAN